MSKSFAINIINDNITECNEMFILTLNIPTPPCEVVSATDNRTEVIIRDNDGKIALPILYYSCNDPTVAVLLFNQSQYSIEENIIPLSVGLMLSRRTSEDVIVEVTITDGSAKGR